MQAGEIVWLLAGIGVGLTLAMLILAGVLLVDGRRASRLAPASAGGDMVRKPPLATRLPGASRPPAEPRMKLAPVPPPATRASEPVALEPHRPEPQASVDDMMSDLAAEIARVQASEPAQLEPPPVEEAQPVAATPAEPPAPEPPPAAPAPQPTPAVVNHAAPAAPDPVVTPAPAPAPATVVPPAPAAAPAPAPAVAAPAPAATTPPPPPKVPPLPKVAPARKFAPALPPRNPPPKSE